MQTEKPHARKYEENRKRGERHTHTHTYTYTYTEKAVLHHRCGHKWRETRRGTNNNTTYTCIYIYIEGVGMKEARGWGR